MTCSRCNAYNGGKAEYCDQCGMKLAVEGESAQMDRLGLPPVPDLTANTVGFPPKDLAALLNETFKIYQNNFLLLLGVSLIGHIPFFIGAFLSAPTPTPAPTDAVTPTPVFTYEVIAVFALGFLAGVLASAATTYIVAGGYLGYRGTAAGGYAAAIRFGPSLLANTLIYAVAVGAAVLLSFVIIGIPLLIFILVAWFFYVQAVMIEGKRPVEALSRSWDLVRSNLLRVMGIGLVYVSITVLAVFAASLPGLLVSGAEDPTVMGNLFTTVGSAIVAPFSYVGAVVVYLDLRARKEGYDVDSLAGDMGWI